MQFLPSKFQSNNITADGVYVNVNTAELKKFLKTGMPVETKIVFNPQATDPTFTYSNAVSGKYFNPAALGVFSISVSSEVYKTKTITIIHVLPLQTSVY